MIRDICFSLMLIGAFASLTFGMPQTQPSNSAVDQLISRLRSETLKLEARKHSVALTGNDDAKAKAAIDFMYDLKGTEVLLDVLAANNRNYDIKEYAAEAVVGLTSQGDIRVADVALAQLKSTDILVGGGSEVMISHARYQRALVRLINKATGKSFAVPKLRDQFASEPISPDEIKNIAQSVDEWLREKRDR